MSESVVHLRGDLAPGESRRVEDWAVGCLPDGTYAAVSGRCRHWGADMAGATVDADGCFRCPWHRAAYDPGSGRMRVGPRGVFERIPGYVPAVQAFGRLVPLARARVVRTR